MEISGCCANYRKHFSNKVCPAITLYDGGQQYLLGKEICE